MIQKGLDIYFEMGTKDSLVDFLLAQGYDDFYFFNCSRYSAGAFLISAEEQVSARREFGLFRLFLGAQEAETLAANIKSNLRDKSIKVFAHDFQEI
ncbi:MAG: DUF3240 family protein [Sulfuricurvum sp.]|uniref:DUF3240 family protein n=1 Tax=Sulfuricurvum sp. TaxID=2025608 RepID=UPI003D13AA92